MPFPYLSAAAIALGAAAGALLRWALSVFLNPLSDIPAGTLVANVAGCFLMGATLTLLPREIPIEWRLFVTTGFLGGLTTFSTFAAEVVSAAQKGRVGLSIALFFLHVGVGLAACLLGALAAGKMRG